MTASSLATRRILVTGADGFLGRGVVAALAREGVHTLVAADVREVPAERRLPGVIYLVQDVRDPALAQTVLRIGTILGERVDNQITALFDKPRLLAIRGSKSPFVFIWDEDVTGAIVHALRAQRVGCFNLAGDGALPLREIARRLGKPVLELPAGLLRAALAVGSALGLSRYGPEQLDFLRYRPVLLNAALKEVLGYVPGKTSAEAFEAFVAARARQGRPVAAAVAA